MPDPEPSPGVVAEDAKAVTGRSRPSDAPGEPPGEPRQNPSELLSAALDGGISTAELEGASQPADASSLNQALAAQSQGQGQALISLADAQAKLPPEVLRVLGTHFKGSPTQVRHRDERDQIF